MRFKAIYLIIFSLEAVMAVAHADTLEVCGDIRQGELLVIKSSNSQAGFSIFEELEDKTFQELKYPVADDGTILVALKRDAPRKITFSAFPGTDFGTAYDVEVAPQNWDIQRIDGVPEGKVTPSRESQAEIQRERRDLGRVLTAINRHDYWRKGFIVPVKGRISGNFGNQRVFNGIPKSPHTGADIAAPEGTPVKAAGDGVVVLSGKDYFYTGNMVVIDHGQGLQTIYAHLKDASVKEKDAVKKGDVIGHVGQTGRATGAHLHWGASLNNVRFNPYSLLDVNEKSCIFIKGVYGGDVMK